MAIASNLGSRFGPTTSRRARQASVLDGILNWEDAPKDHGHVESNKIQASLPYGVPP